MCVCVCQCLCYDLTFDTRDTISEFSSSCHGIGCGTSSDVTITEESSGEESNPPPSKRVRQAKTRGKRQGKGSNKHSRGGGNSQHVGGSGQHGGKTIRRGRGRGDSQQSTW